MVLPLTPLFIFIKLFKVFEFICSNKVLGTDGTRCYCQGQRSLDAGCILEIAFPRLNSGPKSVQPYPTGAYFHTKTCKNSSKSKPKGGNVKLFDNQFHTGLI